MTERLYYADSKLIQFKAKIRTIRGHERWQALILDRTAFYPTGGGQPRDTGLIAGLPVFEVLEDESNDEVLHIMNKDIPVRVGDEVECAINQKRRLDHL